MGNTFSVNMEKVDELRLKKFWTNSELGRKAHLTQGTIYSLKAKRRNASMLTVKKLAAALDVSPAEIIEK
ncbi:helix-turn-helix transcriptional regulator [Acidaminococcus intestini]|uniref:helix-turn-helix transcriptional regulator n=1 Tax=Acidaminococcus intestini TaxID=187327 RepID=UPI003995E671